MKVVKNKIIPFGSFLCVNLFGVLFTKSDKDLGSRTLRHEAIHTAQGREMLWVFFYLWYCAEYLIRLIAAGSAKEAYYSVSFEREAYSRADDPGYLSSRPRFAWLSYLKRG